MVLLLMSLCGVTRAQVEFPAGGVGLDPPPGMALSRQFAGFEDRANAASILIAELPAEAYARIKAGFTDRALAQKGIVVAERREWPLEGAQAFLVRGSQTMQSRRFDKWMLVAGTSTTTALITVQVPEDVDDYSAASIETALRSVQFRQAGDLAEQIASLPFKLKDMAGFRAVRIIANSSLLLTEGPKDVVQFAEQPLVVVASGLAEPPAIGDREAFARQALATLAGVRDVQIRTAEAFDRDGVFWHRIRAVGNDEKTKTPVAVTQVVRFTPAGWIRVVSVVEREREADLAPRLRRLAESVTPQS